MIKFPHELTWEDWVGYEIVPSRRQRCLTSAALTSVTDGFPWPQHAMVMIQRQGDGWDRGRNDAAPAIRARPASLAATVRKWAGVLPLHGGG